MLISVSMSFFDPLAEVPSPLRVFILVVVKLFRVVAFLFLRALSFVLMLSGFFLFDEEVGLISSTSGGEGVVILWMSVMGNSCIEFNIV